ncbi:hypothetical protein HDU98_006532 [Podochytrium sp. JEL0797]|nr:hypothetical protein HDU98_006532 [Podochytrium sp. JEL0797]
MTQNTTDATGLDADILLRFERLRSPGQQHSQRETPAQQQQAPPFVVVDFTRLFLLAKATPLDVPFDDAEAALLLEQVANEVALEKSLPKPDSKTRDDDDDDDDDLQRRIQNLHNFTVTTPKRNKPAKLETRTTPLGAPPHPPKDVADLMSPSPAKIARDEAFCCLCSEDAVLSCPECEDDLYCQHCFKRAHSLDEVGDVEMTKHVGARLMLE